MLYVRKSVVKVGGGSMGEAEGFASRKAALFLQTPVGRLMEPPHFPPDED